MEVWDYTPGSFIMILVRQIEDGNSYLLKKYHKYG